MRAVVVVMLVPALVEVACSPGPAEQLPLIESERQIELELPRIGWQMDVLVAE